MNFRSIGFRLTVWYTAILAGTLAVSGVGVWLALRRSIHQAADRSLRSSLRTVRPYLDREYHDGGVKQLVSELEEGAASLAGAGARLRIFSPAGELIYQSAEVRPANWPSPTLEALPDRGIASTVTLDRGVIRILSAHIDAGIVQLGYPLDSLYDLLEDFTTTALLASPLLLLLTAVLGNWMGRRALRPVDAIVSTARRIGERNLSERLPVPGTEDEIHRLCVALNEMLQRLETTLEKTRRFTADASHELRTPVAVVRTTAEVIRSKARTAEEHAKAWESVETHSRRMSQLIDDLLLLARSDSGSSQMVLEPMDLASVVRQACNDMEVVAANAGVKLSCELPPSCSLEADDEAIRRLVVILLDNAIKYTKRGGRILATLELVASNDGCVAVMGIRDSGIGIAPEDLPHIFDRFYRTSKDRSRDTGGAGLGLSIAKSIVEQHGGKIAVASIPGEGTTVEVGLACEPERSNAVNSTPSSTATE